MHARSSRGKDEMLIVAQARFDRPAGPGSRRGEPRRRLALSTTAQQSGAGPAVDILNLSPGGMLLRTGEGLDLSEALTVALPQAGDKTAEIVWHSGDLYGCRFAEPLSRGEFSAAQLAARHGEDEDEPEAASQPANVAESFGQRLKRLRVASGYSMVGLAAAAGVTKPTLWKWETGRVHPRQRALRQLAGVLGLSESYLLFGIEDGGLRLPQGGSLAETVAASRVAIAEQAGVGPEKVTIDIDFS